MRECSGAGQAGPAGAPLRQRSRPGSRGSRLTRIVQNGSTRPMAARSAWQKPAPEPRRVPILDVSAQKALVEQAAGKSTREVTKMLAELDPALAVPADRVRPLGEGRWELKAVIDADCQLGLEQLKGFLSHVDPRMTLGQLVGRLVSEGLDRHDPGRLPRRGCVRSVPAGADRPLAGQAASSDRGRAPAAKRSATYADAMTSAAKAPAGSGRGVPLPAQRRAQPAGAGNSPANRQPTADCRATSAPKRSAPAGSTDSLAPHTRRDSDGRALSEKRQARPAHIPASAPKSRPRADRGIPAAVRREIWQRDGGRCRYVDPRSGRRCLSRHLLQVDHVLPYALGDGAEPDTCDFCVSLITATGTRSGPHDAGRP